MKQASGYTRVQIALHWIVLALIVVSYGSGNAIASAWRAFGRGEEVGPGALLVHVVAGGAILALALARLYLRLRHGAPAAPEGGHPGVKAVAAVTHWSLYALMIAMPATGLAAWFGGIRDLGDVHEAMFNLLVALVALHVAGAMLHHFVLKDGLLRRMRRAG
ncbi:cytochrome b/b6 domain-containing protein [Defluviimonas sp. WL0024]|uniref:Cytochrome b/b6 domain-containing protein n=1 Tax=Albidovulum salinarum TaxID=2984153 RepID=A0ABT2X5A5_9RHOB|nr:cytochrome b/b6 domain-containing protein [Defluviimonas sp. WL0024]MCU9849122.1 cytochrome b/b6 domain-containing protein [Defluviimonas sp. WL0024]